MTSRKSWLSVVLGWLVVLFCVHHMVATVLANVPGETAPGSAHRRWLAPYIRVTALWQHWSMFQTIPYFASIEPKLVVRMSGAGDRTLDPVLPGLEPYDGSRREAAMFLRFMFPGDDYGEYVAIYLERACGAAEEELGIRPAAVLLRLDSMRMQSLADISRTGQIGRPQSNLSAVQRCR